MKRSPARIGTLLLIALIAVALATGWVAAVPGPSVTASHVDGPRSAVVGTGHEVLAADASVARPQSEWTAAAVQGASPVARTAEWSGGSPAGPRARRSMTIGLLLPPLRI
jgi:hypothetical protein